MKVQQLLAVVLGIVFVSGCQGAGKEKQRFLDARQKVVEGQFAAAQPLLRSFLDEHPDSQYASRAGLFLGKAYLGMRKFEESRAAFQETIDRYPESLEAHKSRYKIAVVDMLVGETREALHQFESIAKNAEGPLTGEATVMADFLRDRVSQEE